jgi:hypothetical protein
MEGRKNPTILHTFEHQEKTANFLNSNSGLSTFRIIYTIEITVLTFRHEQAKVLEYFICTETVGGH